MSYLSGTTHRLDALSRSHDILISNTSGGTNVRTRRYAISDDNSREFLYD